MSQLISPRQPQVEPFLTVDLRSIRVTPAQFEVLCHDNPDLRLELTATGELIVMPPPGSKTGMRNSILGLRVGEWTQRNGTGVCFDSSAGFTLPNGAIRSPDASWVRRDRWESISAKDQEGFAPLCPDFVIELRSPTDRLSDIKDKLAEYVDNGAQLGWLLDPFERRVYLYRSGCAVKMLEDPENVSGDPEVPGFVLYVRELW
jgi:Uma2 family endonuclease